MTPLDALKAGIKSALFVFLTGLIGAISGLFNEANDYFSKGDPINWAVSRAALISLVLALAVGAINALVRYIQVAGPSIVTKLLSMVFGAIPAYPEKDMTKTVAPPPTPDGVDKGACDSGLLIAGACLVIIIVGVIWLIRNL